MKSAKVIPLPVPPKKPDVMAHAFAAWYRANKLASLNDIETAVARIRKLAGKRQ